MLFAHKSYELSQLTCAGPFSATDFVSRLFLIVLQVLGTSIIKLGFVSVPNVENSQRLHQAGMKKC